MGESSGGNNILHLLSSPIAKIDFNAPLFKALAGPLVGELTDLNNYN